MPMSMEDFGKSQGNSPKLSQFGPKMDQATWKPSGFKMTNSPTAGKTRAGNVTDSSLNPGQRRPTGQHSDYGSSPKDSYSR